MPCFVKTVKNDIILCYDLLISG